MILGTIKNSTKRNILNKKIMGWIEPGDYSRRTVNKAGDIVIDKIHVKKDSSEENNAFDTFNNWRESHAYPIHITMITLKKIAKNISQEAI